MSAADRDKIVPDEKILDVLKVFFQALDDSYMGDTCPDKSRSLDIMSRVLGFKIERAGVP